jgi:hypothetical protein
MAHRLIDARQVVNTRARQLSLMTAMVLSRGLESMMS